MGIALVAVCYSRAAAQLPPAPAVSLTPLYGPTWCLSFARTRQCGRARGFTNPLGEAAMSADGHSIYIPAGNDPMLGVVDRDPASGRLAQRRGATGCVASRAAQRRRVLRARTCAVVRGIAGAVIDVAVSPDGRNVYLVTGDPYLAPRRPSSLLAFARSTDGSLARLPGAAGCIASRPRADCAVQRGIAASSVSISPDGETVVTGGTTLSSFRRDPVTGALGLRGCVTAGDASACSGAAVGFRIDAPTWSPDGRFAYARAETAASGDVLVALAPEAPGERLVPVPASCVSGAAVPGCLRDPRLVGSRTFLSAVAVVPTTTQLYLAAMPQSYSSGLAVRFVIAGYDLAADTGAPTPALNACLRSLAKVGCVRDRRLKGVSDLVVAPAGDSVIASADDGILVLRREGATGALQWTARVPGCEAPGPCRVGQVIGRDGPMALLLAPDARFLYLVADSFFATGTIGTLALT